MVFVEEFLSNGRSARAGRLPLGSRRGALLWHRAAAHAGRRLNGACAHDAVLKNQPVTASATVNRDLSGTVETQQQRQQAETDAANVPGVSGIQNNITVSGRLGQAQPAPPPPDQSQQTPPPPPDESQPQAAPQNSQELPPPPPPDEPGQPSQQAPPPAARAPYPQGG